MNHAADKLLCDIYKGSKKEGMYIFVSREDGLSKVPDGLMVRFGAPLRVTTVVLTEDKKLARADAVAVIMDIKNQGFYLQMPPPLVALDSGINENSMLPRSH
ncbi:MAG: YcgL domain-containing protein [Porticoccaceae bacterium]|nr:YcgL domain-containing protein [Porticoccaceae bacterium]